MANKKRPRFLKNIFTTSALGILALTVVASNVAMASIVYTDGAAVSSGPGMGINWKGGIAFRTNDSIVINNALDTVAFQYKASANITQISAATPLTNPVPQVSFNDNNIYNVSAVNGGNNIAFGFGGDGGGTMLLNGTDYSAFNNIDTSSKDGHFTINSNGAINLGDFRRTGDNPLITIINSNLTTNTDDQQNHLLGIANDQVTINNATYNFEQNNNVAQAGGQTILAETKLAQNAKLIFDASTNGCGNGIFIFGSDITTSTSNQSAVEFKAPTGNADLNVTNTGVAKNFGIVGTELASLTMQATPNAIFNNNIATNALVQNSIVADNIVNYGETVSFANNGNIQFTGLSSVANMPNIDSRHLPTTIDLGGQSSVLQYGSGNDNRMINPKIINGTQGGIYLVGANNITDTFAAQGTNIKVLGIDTNGNNNYIVSLNGKDYSGMNVLPYDSTGGDGNLVNLVLGDGSTNVNIANTANASQYDSIHASVTRDKNYTNDNHKVRVNVALGGGTSGITSGSYDLPLTNNVVGSATTGTGQASIWLAPYDEANPQSISTAGQDLNLAIQNSSVDPVNGINRARNVQFTGDGTITQKIDKDVYIKNITNANQETGSIVMGSNVSSASSLNINGILDDGTGNGGYVKTIDAGLANLNLNLQSAGGGHVHVDQISFAPSGNANAILNINTPATYDTVITHADGCGILNISSTGKVAFSKVGTDTVTQAISSPTNRFQKVILKNNNPNNELHLEDGQALYASGNIIPEGPKFGILSSDGNVTISAAQIGVEGNEIASIKANNTLLPDVVATTNVVATSGVYLSNQQAGQISINPVTANDIIAFSTPTVIAPMASGLGKVALNSYSMLFQVDYLGADNRTPGNLGGIQVNAGGTPIITGNVSNVGSIEFASQAANLYLQDNQTAQQNLPTITTTSTTSNQSIYVHGQRLNVNNPVGTENNPIADLVAYASGTEFTLNNHNFFAGISTSDNNYGIVNVNVDAVSPTHLGTSSAWLRTVNVNTANNNIQNVYATDINNGKAKANTFSGDIVGNNFHTGGNNSTVNYNNANIDLSVKMTTDGTDTLNFDGTNTVQQNIEFGTATNRLQAINFNAGSTNNLQGTFYGDVINTNGAITPVADVVLDANNHNINNAALEVNSNANISLRGNTVLTGNNRIVTHLKNSDVGQIILDGAGSTLDAKDAKVNYTISDDSYGITPSGAYQLMIVKNGATSDGLADANTASYTYNLPDNDFASYSVIVNNNIPTLKVVNTSDQAVAKILNNAGVKDNTVKTAVQNFFKNSDTLTSDAKDYADDVAALAKNNHTDDAAESLVHTFTVIDNTNNVSDVSNMVIDVVSVHNATDLSNTTMITYADNGGYAAGELPQCQLVTNAYVQPLYGKSYYKKDKGRSGYNGNIAGVVIGAQTQVNDEVELGGFASFVQSKLKYKDKLRGNRTRIDSYSFGLTAMQTISDRYFIDGLVMVSSNQFKLTNKRVRFSKGNVRTNISKSKTYGTDWLLRLGGGMRYPDITNVVIETFAGVDLNYSHGGSYVDRSANGPKRTINRTPILNPGIYAGAMFAGFLPTGTDSYSPVINPSVKLTLAQKFGKKTKQELTIAGYSTPITVKGTRVGRTTADLQLALTTKLGNTDLTFGGNYTVGKKFNAVTGWLNISIKGLFDFMK